MAYEWDPIRAKRERNVKLVSTMAFAVSAVVIPAAILITALSA